MSRQFAMLLLLSFIPGLSLHLLSADDDSPLAVRRLIGMEYPRLAAFAGAQGKVELLAIVSAEGSVHEVRVLAGHGLLTKPASETLSRWSFNGCETRAAPCQIKVVFTFVLDGICDRSQCGTDFVVDLPASVLIRSKTLPAIID